MRKKQYSQEAYNALKVERERWERLTDNRWLMRKEQKA
jgi:hypothetical protein